VTQAKFGDVLYHKLTEEPIMVLKAFKRFTLVKRPVMGQAGIRYKWAFFLNSELESLQEQTARTIVNIQTRNAIAGAEFGSDALPATSTFKKSN